DANPVGECKRIGTDKKGPDGIIECLERGRDILRSLNFECDDLKARRASRCVCLPQLRHGGAITDIGQYRQTAKTDNNLTQKFKSFASRISVLHPRTNNLAWMMSSPADPIVFRSCRAQTLRRVRWRIGSLRPEAHDLRPEDTSSSV